MNTFDGCVTAFEQCLNVLNIFVVLLKVSGIPLKGDDGDGDDDSGGTLSTDPNP